MIDSFNNCPNKPEAHPEMEVVWDGEKYIPKEV